MTNLPRTRMTTALLAGLALAITGCSGQGDSTTATASADATATTAAAVTWTDSTLSSALSGVVGLSVASEDDLTSLRSTMAAYQTSIKSMEITPAACQKATLAYADLTDAANDPLGFAQSDVATYMLRGDTSPDEAKKQVTATDDQTTACADSTLAGTAMTMEKAEVVVPGADAVTAVVTDTSSTQMYMVVATVGSAVVIASSISPDNLDKALVEIDEITDGLRG